MRALDPEYMTVVVKPIALKLGTRNAIADGNCFIEVHCIAFRILQWS